MRKEGQRFELEIQAAERVELGEEHHWTALIEGDEDYQWRTQKTKHESQRQSSTEGKFHGDTLLASVPRSQKQPLHFSRIGRKCEAVKVALCAWPTCGFP